MNNNVVQVVHFQCPLRSTLETRLRARPIVSPLNPASLAPLLLRNSSAVFVSSASESLVATARGL